MRYREVHVAAPLDALIECVWFLSAASAESGEARAEQRILPDGCVELVCHFGDRFLAVSPDRLLTPQPACFVVGVLTAPLAVLPSGRADTMGVRFRPGCAHWFLSHAMGTMSDRAVELADLWGSMASELWEQLAAAPDDETRVAIVSGTLRDRLARAEPDRARVRRRRRPRAKRGTRERRHDRGAGRRDDATPAAPIRGARRREPEDAGPDPAVPEHAAHANAGTGRAAPTGCASPSSAATPIRVT